MLEGKRSLSVGFRGVGELYFRWRCGLIYFDTHQLFDALNYDGPDIASNASSMVS